MWVLFSSWAFVKVRRRRHIITHLDGISQLIILSKLYPFNFLILVQCPVELTNFVSHLFGQFDNVTFTSTARRNLGRTSLRCGRSGCHRNCIVGCGRNNGATHVCEGYVRVLLN